MSQLLDGKTAIVTGASSGNGRATARRFAEEGANVVVADIRREPRQGGSPTVDVITAETGVECVFVECDVSDTRDLATAVDEAVELGGVDIMVNNAGFIRREEFFEISEDAYYEMMDVNLKGAFFGAQMAGKEMAESDGGSIINLSSVSGLVGSKSSATYSASKGAVTLLTYSLAAQLGPFGIRVNAIHPGTTKTALLSDVGRNPNELTPEEVEEITANIPLRRLGRPEDVANMAVVLASDLTDYVTGASVLVDGGRTNAYP